MMKITTKTQKAQVNDGFFFFTSASLKQSRAASLVEFFQLARGERGASPSNRAGQANVFWCQKLNLSSIKGGVNRAAEVNAARPTGRARGRGQLRVG